MSQSNLPARRGYSAPAAPSAALSPNDLVPILIREARRHRVALVGIFAAYLVVGVLVLIAQPFKPKKRDLFGR